jgi:AcrR family transcriptional regulator
VPDQGGPSEPAATPLPRASRLSRSERRTQLLGAAQEVFIANGYHGAAMDEIAARAGVTKPVLYQHFPGKLELYLALIDAQTEELFGRITAALASTDDNQQRIHGVLGAYFDFVDDATGAAPGGFRLLFESDLGNDPQVHERVQRRESAILRAVADVVADDTGLARPEAELLAVALTGVSQVVARWWLANNRPVSKAVAVSLIETLLWRGISQFPLQSDSGELSAPTTDNSPLSGS